MVEFTQLMQKTLLLTPITDAGVFLLSEIKLTPQNIKHKNTRNPWSLRITRVIKVEVIA